MSLVYDITFPSLPLSSIEISFYDCKERKNAGRGVEVVLVCVCVCVWGRGRGISRVAFCSPLLAQLFLLCSMASLL